MLGPISAGLGRKGAGTGRGVSGTQIASFFADVGASWLAKFGSLLVLPLANEDLAIVAGAYIVVHDLMPVPLVALGIYGGMVASDFALYGIGAGARRMPWLSHYAISDRVREFGDTLKRNLFGLTALCRVVPGAVFVVFVACGWSRVPFGRFTLVTLITSALYLPIVLYLVVVFGDALDDRVGLWTWPLMFVALIVTGFMRGRVFGLRDSAEVSHPQTATSAQRSAPHGVAKLAALSRRAAFGERMRMPLRRNRGTRAVAGGRLQRTSL
jgi:membrane protein DedA with SNARE-associated domain